MLIDPTRTFQQLRELVEAPPAQPTPHPSEPRIDLGWQLEVVVDVRRPQRRVGAKDRLRIRPHRPELQHLERDAVCADALLTKQHRPARARLDEDREDDNRR